MADIVLRSKTYNDVQKLYSALKINAGNFTTSAVVFIDCTFLDIELPGIVNVKFIGCEFQSCKLQECCSATIVESLVHNSLIKVSALSAIDSTFSECTIKSKHQTITACTFVACEGQDVPSLCPSDGEFIGWKKAQGFYGDRWEFHYAGPVILKLRIPADAQRVNSGGKKCRASCAIVEDIQDMDGNSLENMKAYSYYDDTFIYLKGRTVHPDRGFDDVRWHECSSGIHFFTERKYAVEYQY